MWAFSQSRGALMRDGVFVGSGYAGRGEGKNNPAMQNVRNVGPLPRGFYTIAGPVDTVAHGPFCLALIPDENNEMLGRSGFLIHGDSKTAPGWASEGCIVQCRAVRELVWSSGDHRLQVIE